MSHLPSLLTNSPFVVFLAVLLGVLFGQIEYREVSLGSSGTLFAGLLLGFLGFRVEPAYFTLSLVLFVAAVGLLAARDVDDAIRTYGLKFVVIGVVMTGTGAALTVGLVALLGETTDPWLLRGSFMGAHTSSPGLAAALESTSPAAHEALGAGYSVTYVVGIVVVILFEELVPPAMKLDIDAERRRYRTTVCGPDRAVTKPPSVPFSLAGYALAIVLGSLVDQLHVPLGPLGSMTMSLAGGTLIAALVVGYLGHVGPVETRMSTDVLTQIREVALGIFLAVIGVQSSGTFLDAIAAGGLVLIGAAVVVGLGSMLAGLLLATVVWDLDWISTAGAISGGMTSTPGLGAAITVTDTEEVGAAYGATYPFALLGMVFFSKVLVVLA